MLKSFKWALKSKKGVTLVELLVSVAILSLITAPFLASFFSATKNNIAAKEKLVASTYAKKVIEELKNNPSGLVSGDTGNIGYPDDYSANYNITVIEENRLDDSDGTNYLISLYKIEVNVLKDGKNLYNLVTYAKR